MLLRQNGVHLHESGVAFNPISLMFNRRLSKGVGGGVGSAIVALLTVGIVWFIGVHGAKWSRFLVSIVCRWGERVPVHRFFSFFHRDQK